MPGDRIRLILAVTGLIACIIIAVAFVFNTAGDSSPPVTPPGDIQPSITSTATVSTTPPTRAPSPSPTPLSGPPSFSISISPPRASGHAGEVVPYTLAISPLNGFEAPVSLSLEVQALVFFRQTYDLGIVEPPYPRTLTYQFRIPESIPTGVRVNGVLTARSGEIQREQHLILDVV